MKMSSVNNKKIVLFHNMGLSNRNIAKKIGCSHEAVSYNLKKMGLVTNSTTPKTIQMVGKDKARCSKCNEVKPLRHFYQIRRNKKYPSRLSYCRGCKKQQVYNRENINIDVFLSRRFTSIKSRAKRENKEFSITREYYKNIYYNQKGNCFYTGEKMNVMNRGESFSDGYSMSLDRIDNNKGYIEGNVVMCLRKVNFLKSDLTLNEVKRWIPKWYENIYRYIK